MIGDNLGKITQKLTSDRDSEKEASNEEKDLHGTVRKGLEQDIEERKKYSGRVYGFAMGWMIILPAIIVLDAIDWNSICTRFSFNVPEKVLLALMGTTTASVLGSWFVVMNYLFPKQK